MTYHIHELAISLILLATSKEFELFVIICGVYSGNLLFFQAPHLEKESGAERLEILINHLGLFLNL